MALDGLRGYAQAVNDISGIARARLADVVREAMRSELERGASALGLATGDEVARLRRTVERLERRIDTLEPEGAPPERVRRPSAARSRTGAPRPTSMRSAVGTPSGPAGTAQAPGPAAPTVLPVPPVPTGPTTAGARRPVRRPHPTTDAATDKPIDTAPGDPIEGEGQPS